MVPQKTLQNVLIWNTVFYDGCRKTLCFGTQCFCGVLEKEQEIWSSKFPALFSPDGRYYSKTYGSGTVCFTMIVVKRGVGEHRVLPRSSRKPSRYGMAWYGMVWRGMVLYGMVW